MTVKRRSQIVLPAFSAFAIYENSRPVLENIGNLRRASVQRLCRAQTEMLLSGCCLPCAAASHVLACDGEAGTCRRLFGAWIAENEHAREQDRFDLDDYDGQLVFDLCSRYGIGVGTAFGMSPTQQEPYRSKGAVKPIILGKHRVILEQVCFRNSTFEGQFFTSNVSINSTTFRLASRFC